MVVISLGAGSQERWLATKDLDDAQAEAEEERRILAEDQEERDRERRTLIDQAVQATGSRPRSVWTYDADGQCVFANDPRLAHIFRKGR